MRSGGDYFTQPTEPAQRRYEALRAYFVEELSAAEIGARFGYSAAVVHQMASELRSGKAEFFASSKPGPKGPQKSARIRDRVLELRAQDRSVTEIAQALSAEGTPVSAQTVWSILHAEGLERLERRAPSERGAPPPRLEPVKARAIPEWPAGLTLPCDHAGLFLLVPGIVELSLHELIGECGYPSTKVLSAWHSLGTLLLAKCARKPRVSHTHALADDDALGLLLGLTALPKATHLTSYSYRVRRHSNERLLAGLTRHLRKLGLATGEQGFNLDFHAIRHHGTDTPLEKHYVPRRSQRTRAVLTFFAQDHASTEMVYANADLTKAEQAREIIAFADYWQNIAGTDPGLLVFDSKLTTYKVLSELTARGIRWLTLRERGPKLMSELAALPASD
jgi:transposase